MWAGIELNISGLTVKLFTTEPSPLTDTLVGCHVIFICWAISKKASGNILIMRLLKQSGIGSNTACTTGEHNTTRLLLRHLIKKWWQLIALHNMPRWICLSIACHHESLMCVLPSPPPLQSWVPRWWPVPSPWQTRGAVVWSAPHTPPLLLPPCVWIKHNTVMWDIMNCGVVISIWLIWLWQLTKSRMK